MQKEEIIRLIDTGRRPKPDFNVFSMSNTKLKKDGIAVFSLPQGDTCPFAGECLKFCYAKKGNYRFANVKKSYLRNYELALSDKFVDVVNRSVHAMPNAKFFRIHSSGDYFNTKYISKWFQVFRANPDKVFYSYTKSMQLFKHMTMPDNFILIQSEGTKNDSVYMDYDKPFARIFRDPVELTEAVASGKFLDASDSDLQAIKAGLLGLNVALKYH